MRFRIKEDFLSKKKRLAIVISIVIILIVAIFGTSAILDRSMSSEVTAVILVDDEVIHVDEMISFDGSNSSGEIASYEWDFGDGSVSNEAQPTHQYERPGWYNVTLHVISQDGDNDTATTTIGVQYEDIVGTMIIDRMYNIRGQKSRVYNWDIGPNVGNPTAEIDVALNSVVGRFYVYVSIFWNGDEHSNIFSDHVMGTGSSYSQSISIIPDDIPEGVALSDGFIYFEMMIDEGYWSGGTVDIQCIFPTDDLSPPTS
jgi:hypothetical protein